MWTVLSCELSPGFVEIVQVREVAAYTLVTARTKTSCNKSLEDTSIIDS